MDSTKKRQPNRLINEKSPYLLQHAYNPVEWYPWSTEAFEKAKSEDKPIFLSIGYSTCHWCHVMEHESFEDTEVANLMNDTFVNIKVDREERPDIDKVYMEVATTLTGRGGWPLTIIMTPDKEPFVAATYIPKEDRYGQRGMLSLIPIIDNLWKNERDRVDITTQQILATIQTDEKGSGQLDDSGIVRAFSEFSKRFDEKHGGFSIAPKFPSPHNLLFLLRYWHKTKDEWALHMVEKTLESIRMGGIFDHIGFGFHRYSTDQEWLLPHFEKMLYDQAMLMMAYAELYQVTKRPQYAKVIREIHEYVQRDMSSKTGGFFSAEDADSEGVEGKFYVWGYDEIAEVLTKQEAERYIQDYNIDPNGNFRDEATGEETGLNIPHLSKPLRSILESDSAELLERIRVKLLDYREKRVRPHLDDKILVDWNSLMIAALAKAARILGDERILESAENSLNFILQNMVVDGKLYHRYREDEVAIPGFLDDYSYLVWALLEMYETTFDPEYLRKARDFTNIMIDLFGDSENGGFFFSGSDNEELLVRKKDAYDGAIPSGNSIAAMNLVRLSRILGDSSLEDEAVKVMTFFNNMIDRVPTGFSMMLSTLNYHIDKSLEIVIAGEPEDENTKRVISTLRQAYLPNKVVMLRSSSTSQHLNELAPYTRFYEPMNKNTAVHVCINQNCKLPTDSADMMMKIIEDSFSSS